VPVRRVKRPARTVIIIGAPAGVGRAIAYRFIVREIASASSRDNAKTLVRVVAVSGLFWMTFMSALTFSDRLSR
jgi:hypothetical protein